MQINLLKNLKEFNMGLVEVHNVLADNIELLVDVAERFSVELETTENSGFQEVYNDLTSAVDELVKLLDAISESLTASEDVVAADDVIA